MENKKTPREELDDLTTQRLHLQTKGDPEGKLPELCRKIRQLQSSLAACRDKRPPAQPVVSEHYSRPHYGPEPSCL